MIEKTGCWTVPPATDRIRLDKYLALLLPEESRSQIQTWIRNRQVLVNGLHTRASYLVKPADEIRLQAAKSPLDLPQPEDIPLTVIHEDCDIVVIDKPAGLVCHAGAGIRSGTLVNAILFRLGRLDSGDPMRPGIVHRLDKFTSGLIVVAKNPRAHRSLAQQFKSREVTKEYLALVHGRPAEPTGIIDWPLGRDPTNRRKISVRARKKRVAITRYELVKDCGPVSLLRVKPETGRTHQIRVHLSHKGFPVVGDTLYGANRDRLLPAPLKEAANKLQRYFLHAYRLEFRHPGTGEHLSFVAPLPRELQDFLAALEEQKVAAAGLLDSISRRTI